MRCIIDTKATVCRGRLLSLPLLFAKGRTTWKYIRAASAFAGIAIGKIQFYRKGEYQLRQHQADDIKTEQRNFDVARRHVMQTLKEEYDSAGISEAIEHQVLEQAELLGSGSFLRAVQSMISRRKGNCRLCSANHTG